MALFNILRQPMSEIPFVTAGLIKAWASYQRIAEFMQSEELMENTVEINDGSSDVVRIEHGVFSWEGDGAPCLSEININAKQNELIGIVGPVGSGKSSLLSAILGDMYKLRGGISTQGKIAYVPQQAWIQNATVKDNILFNSSFVSQKYQRVLEKCALSSDLTILAAGDQTEIGEKGINLSGGQKQRISLARAVYNDADLYLLDDPLSAVDSHVGRHIFDNVVGPNGVLKNKTRVLVTHGLKYLPECDYVYMMKNGKIIESGTYNNLMENGKAFAELLAQYAVNQENNMEDKYSDDIVSGEESDWQLSTRSKSISSFKKYRRKKKSEHMISGKLIDEEGVEEGNIDKNVYIHYIKNVGLFCCFVLIFGFGVHHIFDIAANQWLSIWSSDKLLPNGSINKSLTDYRIVVFSIFGIFQGLGLLSGLFSFNIGSAKAGKATHDIALKRVLRAPMSLFDTTPMGRLLNRFSRDINTMDTTLIIETTKLVFFTWKVIGAMIIICINMPVFTTVAVVIFFVYCGILAISIKPMRHLMRLESIYRSPVISHISEALNGSSSIRAYDVTDIFIHRAYKKVDENTKFCFAYECVKTWLAIILQMVGVIAAFFTALFAVLARGSLGPAVVGLTLNYATSITLVLFFLVKSAGIVESNVVSVERLLEYTKLPQEADWSIDEKKPHQSWPREGEIEFTDYQTRYREGLCLVLKGINIKIQPSEKIGIVGRTGAGKSSLTLALFRLIEAASGKIEIDGVNSSKIGLHDLRKKLTIIPQDPVLFSGSLRMNLDPFNEYSDEEIWNALNHAHLKEFTAGLQEGLEYPISEAGMNLSVGQRQLMCLGRALLRHTKILILDEATAAIDIETDDLIQQTIRKEFKDCTILTIAHRLNTIMDSDRVLVLSDGKVIESGSPSYLLANKNSEFYSMAVDAGLA